MRVNHATAYTRGLSGILTATTTAALSDVANAINTTGKTLGLSVWDSTAGLVMVADGALAASTWTSADGQTVITPE